MPVRRATWRRRWSPAPIGTEIRKVLAREGQVVKQGDILVELDTTVAEEELRIAQLQRECAEASKRKLRSRRSEWRPPVVLLAAQRPAVWSCIPSGSNSK